jgi:hypothetical protein
MKGKVKIIFTTERGRKYSTHPDGEFAVVWAESEETWLNAFSSLSAAIAYCELNDLTVTTCL